MHNYFIDMSEINWLIAGDFNRDPPILQAGLDTRITNHIRIVVPILLCVLAIGVQIERLSML